MRAVEVSKRLSRALFSFSSYSRSLPNFLPSPDCHRSSGDRDTCLLRFPWSATQQRAVKVNASHVRPGNVIEKSGKMYQVIDAEHKQRGRGGAMMQMELRDIDTGNKVSLRFGTEEAVERVFVEDKSFTCLYTENDTAFVIESETFEQLEVPLDVFGKAGAYLQDLYIKICVHIRHFKNTPSPMTLSISYSSRSDEGAGSGSGTGEGMKVWLQLYDGRALSGSIPKRVACTIKEIHASTKGPTVTPRAVFDTTVNMLNQRLYRRALLDNGVTVMIRASKKF
ncbi:EFP domain-containing protein [Citrus sinensis]|uniref:EFP domain-containing protein n=2 Tax=Citrus sinensis TaxID=2711 RepID=A0ACB8MU12_CITSI|nr:EFP domain-containing protein [Citrus sinensis]KAH9789087.1 EFP domain-containing protein [Citrus sinensis]